MSQYISRHVRNYGYCAAICAAVFSIIYDIGQLFEWMGWMGSGGGPEHASTITGLVILLTPSLFLAPAFLAVTVSIHYLAAPERKIWSHTGVVFATIYTTLVSINYFVLLTFVIPHMQRDTEAIRMFLFKPFDSFLYSVDLLGYSFMSLSTLFSSFVFHWSGREKPVKLFMMGNAIILPFIALQNYWHVLIWPASSWGIIFPGAMITYARLLKHISAKIK